MAFSRQRIRDPLHNLIEFRANEFEHCMWQVLQTEPFQRLRRIKQLGFSEIVYPGATHTRFAHSVGVFHTARQLIDVIRDRLGEAKVQDSRMRIALAAALVHDVGHGPFSHAFEDVGLKLKLKIGNHERIGDEIIRTGELCEALKVLGSGFASDVADVIVSTGPKDIFGAVVSSQFDADRLDYMQRDRLMTGTQHGAVDFNWLLSNIEIGEVPYGVDEERVGMVETFVLGPKATYAAESYLLGLFQLYPTVYFHKATRGAEKLFSAILYRLIELVRAGRSSDSGLSDDHSLIVFAKEPDKIGNILTLDDSVIWGALSMMANAKDETIANFSSRLRNRKLFKCYDVREMLAQELKIDSDAPELNAIATAVSEKLAGWVNDTPTDTPRILIDEATREIYKQFQESKGPLNQIQIKKINGDLVDVASVSKVVAAMKPFKLLRVYIAREDGDALKFLRETVVGEAGKNK